MATEIEAKEVTVSKLFSPDFMFEIPIYQRPLSWSKDNFEQLFEDIYDAMYSNENQYFLGSILLQEHKDEENKYDIVDGQQRISALAILMAVIRDFTQNVKLKQNLNSYLYQEEDPYKEIPAEMRVVPWKDLKSMFEEYIYKLNGTKTFLEHVELKTIKYKDVQDPQYHLYEAINIFNEKLKEKLFEPDNLERYVIYLLKKVYLVYIKAASFASAFRLFNVLNTRGLLLSTSDLLKSENLGEIKDESMRLQYANIWRDIENNLGGEELENLIAFIRTIQLKEKAKLSIYEEYRKKIFKEQLLNTGKEFIDYLKDIAEIYSDKILEGKIVGETRKENEYKNIVNLLIKFVPFSDWIPNLIAFYYKFRKDKYLLDFILKLEKKVIIEWSAGFSFTERITSLNRILDFIESENEPQKVVDELLFYKEPLSGRLPRMLDFGNKNQIDSILIDKFNDAQFYNIYGGKFAKYILLRIDMECWDLENFTGYPGTITVEHILPQTPFEDSEWVKIFREELREEWTNKLGNLVLLNGRKNSKAQNYDFNKKKNVYFKEKSTSFRITKWLEDKDKWTLEELKSRHEELINKAMNIFLNY